MIVVLAYKSTDAAYLHVLGMVFIANPLSYGGGSPVDKVNSQSDWLPVVCLSNLNSSRDVRTTVK